MITRKASDQPWVANLIGRARRAFVSFISIFRKPSGSAPGNAADEEVSERGTSRRADIVRVVLALGIAVGLGSTGTLALMSTGAEANPGVLQAGTLDVVVNGELATVANIDGTHVEATWEMTDLLPGEYLAVEFEVANAGASTMPLDYTLHAYGTGVLANDLSVRLYQDATAANPDGDQTTVGWNTWRRGSCTGGTQVKWWSRLGEGTSNAIALQGTKQPLAVGESDKYCIYLALDSISATWNNPALLGGKSTLVLVVRGTQKGAP